MFRQSTSEGSSAYQPQRFLNAIRPSHCDLPAEFQQKSARSTCQTLTGISKLFPPEVDHSILAVSRRTSERSSVVAAIDWHPPLLLPFIWAIAKDQVAGSSTYCIRSWSSVDRSTKIV
ncbi:hypothetical protein NEUTE1DRAFT_94447, partial [Neurospora tetrasperma FGSC 2508]